MKWSLSLLALCALLGVSDGIAAEAPSEGTLLKTVVLSRHGVRSPTQSPETLGEWSRKDWPAWPVPAGELTPRGAALVTELWKQQAVFLREAGLLPTGTCPEAGTIAVRADREQRTEATAAAVLEGLAPGCGVQPLVNRSEPLDPLFHPVEAGYCALDPAIISREILGKDGQALVRLEQELSGPLADLAVILGPASPEFCRRHALPEGCTVADEPSRLTFAKDNRTVHLEGALGTASSAAEILLLEYGQWDRPAGWGVVDKARLERLLPVHSRVFDAVNRTPAVAAARGSELLLDMANALTGRYADPAVNRAKIVVFVGHDTNIATVGGLLGLHWQLPGYAPDEIPPASALVLSLWLDNGEYRLRVQMLGQSPETLHDPAMQGALLRQELEVPWCGPYLDGRNCTLTEFELRVRDVIRPDCVRER